MSVRKMQRFCEYCDSLVLAEQQTPNHILHLLLTLVTGGLWLLVWIFLPKSKWQCPNCGSNTVSKSHAPKRVRLAGNVRKDPRF